MQSTPHAQSAQSTAKPKLPQLLVPAASSLSAMQIQLVVACGRDRAIGERGTMPWYLPADLKHMPWYLPADLKHFKSTTAHTCLIMGRKTFESIGRALPLRRNIVVSSDQSLAHTNPNIEVATSFEAALELATVMPAAAMTSCSQSAVQVVPYGVISIIGGAGLFARGLEVANRLEITEIAAEFPQADTYFPEIDLKQWQVEALQPVVKVDAEAELEPCYYFCVAEQPQDFAQHRMQGLKLVGEDGQALPSDTYQQAGLAYRYVRYGRR